MLNETGARIIAGINAAVNIMCCSKTITHTLYGYEYVNVYGIGQTHCISIIFRPSSGILMVLGFELPTL